MLASCPKCDGAMQDGFILDVVRNGYRRADWIEGLPEPSFWTGIKIKGKTRRPVLTVRCQRCGYLESYARGG